MGLAGVRAGLTGELGRSSTHTQPLPLTHTYSHALAPTPTPTHPPVPRHTPQATEALRITPDDLLRFGVMDEKVQEPLGAAHTDPMAAFPYVKEAILRNYRRWVLW